jgi:hypothetical protein
MSHARQQIREAAALAVTGLASTGANVFQSRKRPVGESKLPALLVFTDDEAVAASSIHGPALLDRKLQLRITGLAKDPTDLDDALDTIAAEVETALGNTTLGGKVQSLVLSSINVDFDDSTDKPVGQIVLTYEANYFTVANAPATAL